MRGNGSHDAKNKKPYGFGRFEEFQKGPGEPSPDNEVITRQPKEKEKGGEGPKKRKVTANEPPSEQSQRDKTQIEVERSVGEASFIGIRPQYSQGIGFQEREVFHRFGEIGIVGPEVVPGETQKIKKGKPLDAGEETSAGQRGKKIQPSGGGRFLVLEPNDEEQECIESEEGITGEDLQGDERKKK